MRERVLVQARLLLSASSEKIKKMLLSAAGAALSWESGGYTSRRNVG